MKDDEINANAAAIAKALIGQTIRIYFQIVAFCWIVALVVMVLSAFASGDWNKP